MSDHQAPEDTVGGEIYRVVAASTKNLCITDFNKATPIIRALGTSEKQRVEYTDIPKKRGHTHPRCYTMAMTCEASITYEEPKSKKPRIHEDIEQEAVREPQAEAEQEVTSPNTQNESIVVVEAAEHRGFKPNIFQLGPFFYPSTSNPHNFFLV